MQFEIEMQRVMVSDIVYRVFENIPHSIFLKICKNTLKLYLKLRFVGWFSIIIQKSFYGGRHYS